MSRHPLVPWLAVILVAHPALASSPAERPSPGWVQRTVERTLSEKLRGDVRFGSFEVDWFRLEARFRNARVDLKTPSGHTASARVESGRMGLSWTAVAGLAGGSVRISAVEVDRPRIRLSSAFLREWSPAPGGGRDVEIRLDRVALEGGDVEWIDAPSETRVEASDVRIDGSWSTSRRALVGEFAARATIAARGFAEPLAVRARGAFVQRSGSLELHTVRASAPGASAEGGVWAKFEKGATTWSGSAELDADAAALAKWFTRSGLPVGGRLHAATRIGRGPGEPFRIEGRVTAREATMGRLLAPALEGQVTVGPEGAEVRELRGEFLGGSVEGSLRLPFGAERGVHADLLLRAAEGRLLAEALGRPLPLASRLDADVRLSIPSGERASWTADARVTAAPSEGRGVPVGGNGVLALAAGRLRAQRVRLVAPSLEGSVDFDVPLVPGDAPGRFAWQTRTDDAGPSQRATLRILEALGLGLPSWIGTPLTGRGTVDGEVVLGAKADWEIRLDLEDGSWGGEAFDSASVDVRRSGDLLEIENGRVGRGDASLHGSARLGMEPFEVVSVDATAVGVHARPLLARWGGFEDLDGLFRGEISLVRSAGGLDGGGSFRVENGSAWGEPFDLLQGTITASGGRFELTRGTLEGPLLTAEITGRYESSGQRASGSVRFGGLRPGSSARLLEAGVRLEGTWSGSGTWGWSRAEGPEARLDLEADGIGVAGFLGPADTGPAVGTLSVAGGRVGLALAAAAKSWLLEASLDLADRFPFDARLDLDRFAVAPPGLERSGISAHLSGSTRITGFLSDPDSVALDASFEPLAIYVPGGRFDAARPVVVWLRDRKLVLERTSFVTAGASLEAAFDWDLEDDAVSGDLRGRADLSLLSLLRRELRGSGKLDVDVRLGGSFGSPTLDGRATVAEGRLRWVGLRQALDGIEAAVTFDGRSVRLDSFRALMAGGDLNGRGELTLEGEGSVRFEATVGVSEVSVEFPEGFRGLYDGALRLEGTNVASVLSGRLSLVRGVYDENFDVTRMAASRGREIERSGLEDLPPGIALDVEIAGADDVWLRNNLGRLEAGVSIQVGGELRRPTLDGRIVLFEGGRLRFRDVDYRVTAGSLEFEGDQATNPFVELRAETRVADYDVRLRVAGRLDALAYEMTSYPTLAESDIIYLLVTGEVPASSATTSAGGSTGVPGGLAADYFAGVLTAGFSRQLEKTLRLDQVQINPLLESGEDPTARVTVGKQVTDRVRILYTIDVGAVEDDTYVVEWQATRRWRLTGEQGSDGAYIATTQFTDRYGRSGAVERGSSALGEARAPESFVLRSASVVGPQEEEARRLEGKANLEDGKTIRRADLVLAGEAIRRDLVRRGFLDSQVTTRVDTGNDGTAVEFRVEPGVRTEVRLEGLSGRSERAVRRSLREFFEEGITGLERDAEVAEIVLDELRIRGHFAADVLVQTEESASGERTLRIAVDPGPPIRASKVALEGVSQVASERVRKQVLTGRKEGLKSRPLSPAVLGEDARGILALYRREGYLDAEVDPALVRLSVDGESAEVLFRVREGELQRIEAVDATAEGPVDSAEIEGWSGLAVGQPASASAWPEAVRKIRAALDARGFPQAQVEVRPDRNAGTVTARIEVRTGPKMVYAGAAIEGNFRTRDKIIRREIPFEPGEPISSERLRELQHRLYRLGVFQDVRVSTEAAAEDGPDARRLRIAVSEAKPVSLGVGVGYDTDAGPRLSFAVGHDNLGGYHRSLTLQTRWSDIEKRIQVVGRDPWLFNRRLDSTATYFWETLEENGYDLQRNSLAFRVERQLPSNWKRFLRYNFQEVDIDIYEVTDEVIEAIREQKLQDLTLGDVGVTFARDTRDDSFLPTRGGYALAEFRIFLPVFFSDQSFLKAFLQGSATHTFSNRASYSVAARVGAAKTLGSTVAVPLPERYFAGGSSTLRGFERDTVGLVVEEIPIGGEAMLILNQEIRWPIWKGLQLVGFTDWGNVYTDLQSFDPTELRYTAGAGVRFATPIGPLRFEYGHKLDRREGESSGEFYFAVGTIY